MLSLLWAIDASVKLSHWNSRSAHLELTSSDPAASPQETKDQKAKIA